MMKEVLSELWVAFVVAWKLMVPLLLLAIAVVTYLRFARDKDGL